MEQASRAYTYPGVLGKNEINSIPQISRQGEAVGTEVLWWQ